MTRMRGLLAWVICTALSRSSSTTINLRQVPQYPFREGLFTEQEWCLIFRGNNSCSDSGRETDLHVTGNNGMKTVSLEAHPECYIGVNNTSPGSAFGGPNMCGFRAIGDRVSLRSEWVGTSKSFPNAALELVHYLVSQSSGATTVNLVFVGDSVTAQFSSFLVCSLIRAGLPLLSKDVPFRHDKMRKKMHIYSEFSIPSENVNLSDITFRVHNVRLELPCEGAVRGERCTGGPDVLRQMAHQHTTQLLSAVTAASMAHIYNNGTHIQVAHRNFVVFNYGLHTTEQNSHQKLTPVIQALYDAASLPQNRMNTTFLFRESTSQSFGNTKDGSYDVNAPKHLARRGVMCCDRPAVSQRNWRDEMVMHILRNSSVDWMSIVGWIPFHDISKRLYDMHVEYRPKQAAVDCTHFVFSPLTYDILWWQMRHSLRGT